MTQPKTASKFTPGPWRLCYDGQIDGADGSFVCSFRWSSYKDFNEPRNKANAHLIAAAPEMYELLESLAVEGGDGRSIDAVVSEARRIKAEIDGEG